MTKQLILASKSPRRTMLMSEAKMEFIVIPSDAVEAHIPNESPSDMVMRLAIEKASYVAKDVKNSLVIGSDTIVVFGGGILGKPKDESDAFSMLKKLSGNSHTVYTGVCVYDSDTREQHVSYRCTKVKFRKLSDEEIQRYISTKEPMDKAGAYAIQGRGSLIVESIEGDYTNVVGLPMGLLVDLLKAHGYNIL